MLTPHMIRALLAASMKRAQLSHECVHHNHIIYKDLQNPAAQSKRRGIIFRSFVWNNLVAEPMALVALVRVPGQCQYQTPETATLLREEIRVSRSLMTTVGPRRIAITISDDR
jgi:hypothetical protein